MQSFNPVIVTQNQGVAAGNGSGTPVSNTDIRYDAATQTLYVPSSDGNSFVPYGGETPPADTWVNKSGDTMTGDLDLSGNDLQNAVINSGTF